MVDPNAPDSPRRGPQPSPRVTIIVEKHTHSDDDLMQLARIARRGRRGPDMVTTTTRGRLPKG